MCSYRRDESHSGETKMNEVTSATQETAVPDVAISPLAVTRKQAAELLAVSVRTIDNLILIKELKAVRIGKSVRIPYSSLRAFIAKDHATREQVIQ